MLKVRVIPVLFLMNGLIVRSEEFHSFKIIGNPYSELERYSEWLADELIYVDISREDGYDLRRDDHKVKDIGNNVLDILREISKHAFMPLTFGGNIKTMDQIDSILRNGADKVVINTAAYQSPDLVRQAALKHGSQAIVVGIDVKRESSGDLAMYVGQGRQRVEESPADYATAVENLGAGEIFLNSIDRDGTAEGYDTEATRAIVEAVNIPVIACGGVGVFGDFVEAIDDGHANAVAAGNLFHFTENAYPRAKKYLRDRGCPVRYSQSNWRPRQR